MLRISILIILYFGALQEESVILFTSYPTYLLSEGMEARLWIPPLQFFHVPLLSAKRGASVQLPLASRRPRLKSTRDRQVKNNNQVGLTSSCQCWRLLLEYELNGTLRAKSSACLSVKPSIRTRKKLELGLGVRYRVWLLNDVGTQSLASAEYLVKSLACTMIGGAIPSERLLFQREIGMKMETKYQISKVNSHFKIETPIGVFHVKERGEKLSCDCYAYTHTYPRFCSHVVEVGLWIKNQRLS